MQKSNGIMHAILNIAIFLIFCCCYFFVAKIAPYQSSLKKLLFTLLFALGGLLVMYLLHNILHELFHCIFAIFGGARITAISFWGFTFDLVKGGIKFSFINSVAGWSAFVVKNTKKAKLCYKLSLIGAFIATLSLLVAGAILPFLLDESIKYYTLATLGLGSFATLYLLVVNFLSFEPFTDGFNLFCTTDMAKSKVNNDIRTLQYESCLYYNQDLGSIDSQNFLQGKSYYDMLKAIYEGKFNESLILGDSVCSGIVDEGVTIAVDIEQLFVALLTDDSWEITELYNQLADIIEEADTLQKIRVAYAYHKYNKELEWCEALKSTFYKLLDSEPKGLASSEKYIFEKFCL